MVSGLGSASPPPCSAERCSAERRPGSGASRPSDPGRPYDGCAGSPPVAALEPAAPNGDEGPSPPARRLRAACWYDGPEASVPGPLRRHGAVAGRPRSRRATPHHRHCDPFVPDVGARCGPDSPRGGTGRPFDGDPPSGGARCAPVAGPPPNRPYPCPSGARAGPCAGWPARRPVAAGPATEQRCGAVLGGGPVRARLRPRRVLAALAAENRPELRAVVRRGVLDGLVVRTRRLPHSGHAEQRHLATGRPLERRRVLHRLVVGARRGLPRAREAERAGLRGFRTRPRTGLPGGCGAERGGLRVAWPCPRPAAPNSGTSGAAGRRSEAARTCPNAERQVEPGLRPEQRRPAVLGRHAVGAGRGLAVRVGAPAGRRGFGRAALRRQACDHGGGVRAACARRLARAERRGGLRRAGLRRLAERRLRLARPTESRRACLAEHRRRLRHSPLGRLPERRGGLVLPGSICRTPLRIRCARLRRLPEHRLPGPGRPSEPTCRTARRAPAHRSATTARKPPSSRARRSAPTARTSLRAPRHRFGSTARTPRPASDAPVCGDWPNAGFGSPA